MRRRQRNALLLVFLACAGATPALSQDLFEQYDAKAKDAAMTEERTEPGERESIF